MKGFSRICITGAKGMLGSLFVQRLSHTNLLTIDLPEIDITHRPLLLNTLREFKPQLIIHCASYNAVDKAESEVEKTFLINALATEWIAQYSAENNAQLVYFSTDYVFCGSQGRTPRNEFFPPSPCGVYALSKFAGEEAIRRCQPRHFIIRTSWLYGPNGVNFVNNIIKATQERPFLKVVSDQIGTPTHTFDLVEYTIKVIENGEFGLYHISGNGQCSWFEYAQSILHLASIKTKVYPVSSAEYGALAPRPAYSVLDHFHLRNTVGDNIPLWPETLKKQFHTINPL